MSNYENISLLVFRNENKKEDKHPDYSVKIKIGDKFEDVGAGWTKTSQKGTKFLSLSIKVVPLQNAVKGMVAQPDGKPQPFPTDEGFGI